MSSTQFYLLGSDIALLLDHLQDDDEIAFIVSGPGRFLAQRQAAPIRGNKYLLWHVLSGPLPSPQPGNSPCAWITDPFAGWDRAPESPMPWFGVDCTTVFNLVICPTTDNDNVWHAELAPGSRVVQRQPDPNGYGPPIGVSTIGWLGNRYNVLGAGALKTTQRWWQRFGRWVRKRAVRINPFGSLTATVPRDHGVYAFPEALSEIRRGRFRGVNPSE
jgi:hypothetical protein